MATPITLTVFRGDELVRTEQFNREIIKIGRLASAHLCLDDDKISRIHSVIEVAPDGAISIIDMGSAEGTFVNGKKVSRGALRMGDRITLGGLRIVLESPDARAALSEAVATPNHAVVAPTVAAPAPAKTNGHANGTNGKTVHAVEAPAASSSHEPAPAPRRRCACRHPSPPRPRPPRPARRCRREAGAARAPRRRRRGGGSLRRADLGVELRVMWGDTLLEAGTFIQPKAPVLLGESPKCDVRLEGLPVDDFPVLRFEDGEYRFTFARGMTGVVEERAGKQTFGELVRAKKAAQDEKVEGAYWIPVPRAGAVRAEIGAQLAVEARPKRPERVKGAPFWERINYQFLNLFLVLFFVQAGFMVAANNFPYDTDVVADDLFKNPSRMAKFIIKPPEPQKKLEAPKGEKKGDPGEMAEKHKGEEGQMGKKDAPKTNARSAPKAIDPNAKEI